MKGNTMSKNSQFDLLIKGGRVIDTAQGIDRIMDVGLREGKIAILAENMPVDEADQVLIDEARTPLVISGGATSGVRSVYKIGNAVQKMVSLQAGTVASVEDGLRRPDMGRERYRDGLAKLLLAAPRSGLLLVELARDGRRLLHGADAVAPVPERGAVVRGARGLVDRHNRNLHRDAKRAGPER